MDNKLARVIFNGIRFIGNPQYLHLLGVDTTAVIKTQKKAALKIGKNFRCRRNVELNVRNNGELIIGDNVFLNSSCIITAREKVKIGNNTIFGPNVIIYDNDHLVKNGVVSDNEFETAPVEIGNNVWIGANTVILKGTKIEDGCIIAAGSIVKGNISGGNVVIQKRETSLKPIGRNTENS